MSDKKVPVVMTVSGRVKEHPAGATIMEVLQNVYTEHQHAGSNWDRPAKLFIGGECIVETELADLAWEFGKFQEKKWDELDAALNEWVDQRFGGKTKEAA